MRGSPLELMDSVRTWRTMNGGLKRITHYDIMNGGNSTHCLAPLITSTPNYTCNILTRRPSDWSETIEVVNEDMGWMRMTSVKGKPNKITDDPREVIPESDIIWFAG